MGKIADLTGNRYGKLVALERAEDRYTISGRRLIRWKCRCDCGSIVEVDANNLRNGNTTSCGCKTNCVDMTGKRVGKLLVLSRAENDSLGNARWNCICDCGNKTVVNGVSLRIGCTKSCGCGMVKGLKVGWEAKTHGMSKTRIYRIWCGMKKRTSPTADERHKRDYFYRGIRMCDEWKDSFETFYDWSMKNGYEEDLSIDRIDNDGNYSPENCRWVGNSDQSRNRRTTIVVEYAGDKKSLLEWADYFKIDYEKFRVLFHKHGFEKALEIMKEGDSK